MLIRELMSTDVDVVDWNDSLRIVEDRMKAGKLRHVPVMKDGAIVGLVSQRDLFKAAMSSAMGYGERAQKAFFESVRAKEIMTEPVVTVTPDTPVAEAIDLLVQRAIGCLPAVENGKLVGIVTKTDLLRYFRDSAENA
jgi:CBS domain-containing protein